MYDCLFVPWCLNSDKGSIEMMNAQQSKDFAEELFGTWDSGIFEREDVEQVVDELRRQFDEIKRLRSVNAALLEAFNTLLPEMRGLAMVSPLMKTYVEICEAAIAKASGLNKAQE
jgi:hypothetical protein